MILFKWVLQVSIITVLLSCSTHKRSEIEVKKAKKEVQEYKEKLQSEQEASINEWINHMTTLTLTEAELMGSLLWKMDYATIQMILSSTQKGNPSIVNAHFIDLKDKTHFTFGDSGKNNRLMALLKSNTLETIHKGTVHRDIHKDPSLDSTLLVSFTAPLYYKETLLGYMQYCGTHRHITRESHIQ